jgi:hypothetical protein
MDYFEVVTNFLLFLLFACYTLANPREALSPNSLIEILSIQHPNFVFFGFAQHMPVSRKNTYIKSPCISTNALLV